MSCEDYWGGYWAGSYWSDSYWAIWGPTKLYLALKELEKRHPCDLANTYWGEGYFADSYWADSYWGVSGTNKLQEALKKLEGHQHIHLFTAGMATPGLDNFKSPMREALRKLEK